MTLLPRLAEAVEARRSELAVVPFADPAPGRTIGLAWRRRSPRSGEYRELGAWLAGHLPGGTRGENPRERVSGRSRKSR